MNKSLFFLSVLLFVSAIAQSQRQGNAGAQVPEVAIGIVVENMRPDYIDRYWNKFGDDGFRKLWSQGTVCSGFRMKQHILNSASGTATLYTGQYPTDHGIIDVSWYDRLKEASVHCVSDEEFTLVGGATGKTGGSPLQLKTVTLGDQLKLFHNGKANVYSIAMNDASAIFSSGFSGNGAWWFDPESGNMVTSTYYMESLPSWVNSFNKKNLAQKFASRNWAILKTMTEYSESTEDKSPLETGYGEGKNAFPHSLGSLVKTAGNYTPLKTTPFANTIVKEFLMELLDNEQVGKDQFTDLVTVVFSSMDYENGSFGPASVEMQDLYLRLDQEIAEIVHYAEKKYGKENLLIFLTANSSASYPGNYLKEKFKIPAGNFSPESSIALLNSFLNITYGDLKWIEYNNGLQLYLNHKIIELNRVDLKEIRGKVADFLSQFEGIKTTVTADQIREARIYNNDMVNVSHSFAESRSGDVLLVLQEGWQPTYKFKKITYSDQPLLPLVFYGGVIQGKIIKSSIDATSLVPTISEILKIPVTGRNNGEMIEGF